MPLLKHRLTETCGTGVSCEEQGLFVGDVPLLEKVLDQAGRERFAPRQVEALNRDLSQRYGFPIDTSGKLAGLRSVARALEDGELAYAQMVSLYLKIPDPPSNAALTRASAPEVERLAGELIEAGIFKLEWDPARHPRWPAGSAGGVGGRFAPEGQGDGSTSPSAGFTSDQSIDIPLDEPFPLFRPTPAVPRAAPYPPGEGPVPLIGPIPRNPYPDRPKCVKEWEEAWKYCRELERKGELGKPHSWLGRNIDECMRGQVSEDCGGNPIV